MVCFADPNSVEVGCEEWELVIGSLVASPDGEVEGSETPSIVNVEAVSSTSVKVIIKKPVDITGIEKYTANIKGDESKSCDMKEDEGEENLSCEISDLSPGTQYAVNAYSWLGDEASSLRSDPDEKSGWTKPSAPSIVNVEAVSSTSVKVIIKKPVDITGIEKYTANIKGDESKSCDMKEDEGEENLSCEISDLSPGTQYTVNAYSWLGDEASSLRSDPDEKSGWTKPSAPSIVNVEAVSSTSVKVIIKKPVDITGIEKYMANIKGDESKSCDMKEDEGEENLSCEISGLSPGTQYTVNAYSWLGDEASSLRSDPDEKSGWTKPSAPSIVNVEAVSSTSVKVIIKKPVDITGIEKYTANIKGDESKSCDMKEDEGEENLSCEISDLSPGTQYTVNAYSWLGDEASSLHSDPDEKSGWTKPSAPSIVNVEAVSSTSVKVIIKKPVDITGIEKYTANIKGDESKSCDMKEDEGEENLSCEISGLSPGTQYTVNAYSWLGDEASSLRSDPDEKSGWTKPSAPSIVNVEAVSSTSVKVIIKKPVDITGIEKYTANIKGDESKSCDMKEDEGEENLSCEISDLSPGTQYTVNAYSWLGDEASSLHSDPDEKSGWTKPSAPSIVNVEAVSSTSVKVIIKKPVDITGIEKYTANIKGDESKSCDMKEDEGEENLSCEISGLSPGTQYTVNAYSWLGDEASSLRSDPDEKSGWTKPSAPSIVNVEAVSSTSVKVIIKKPVDITGIEKYTANIKGDESKSCDMKEDEGEENLSCEISGLSPGTQYTVNAYSWLGDEASSLRSDPDEKSGWTKPSAPSIVNVEAVSSTSVKVIIKKPVDITGIEKYMANIKGDESKSCDMKEDEGEENLSCEISGLSPGTQYTVNAYSWLGDEASSLRSDPDEKSGWTKPSAPSIVNVEAASSTSVKVIIKKPVDITGIEKYTANIKGDESKSCDMKEDEGEENLSCEISGLSPGTQYTVNAYSWLGDEASSLRSDPDEKSGWTKPSAPSIVNVEAVSSTSVKVIIKKPVDITGIEKYTANIKGDESKSCDMKEDEGEENLSCEISGLSPGTQYTVNAYSWLGDEASSLRSDPDEKSGWTKPSAPSIVNVEAVSSTSVKVIIKKPVDITGIEKYTANIKGDESKSCDMKEDEGEENLSCEISGLSPGTQYTVNAYSWLGDEASSLRSDPDEKSGWTKPSAPSIVNVEAVSSTSVKVIIKKPVDITGIEKYTANIKGDESKSCDMKEDEGEENLSCEISGLSPGTQYTVNAYSWLGDEASSLRSDPDEKSGWTKPSAPSIVNVEAVSSTSVKVIIKKPVDITGIEKYTANIKGDESKSCDMKEDEGEENLSCEISGLSPGTQYTVNAYSWLGDEASSLRSDPDEKSGWTKPSAPSIVNVEAASSTSVKVIIKKPVDITGIEKYTANIKGDESKSCDMKEDEGEENLSCEISGLSPGTQYTVNAYSWLGDEASSLRSDPDEKSGWTKPSAPSIVNVEAVSSTSVKVIIKKPVDITGIEKYMANIKGDESKSCDMKEDEGEENLSCEISGLSPGTQYTVNAYSWLGDEASSLRSDPDEKSGWTKPSAPSIVNVEAVSSTSVKVIIKKPVDITGIEKYTANIKGDESKSCDMKEDEGEENLSCEISGLSPGTQYTVNAYSWLGDEASSLRSDPDEKSGWTKPSAPSIVNVEAVSSTSVKVIIKKPVDIIGIEKYTANIKGDESKSCDMKEDEGEENLSCEISGLSPGTQYTVNAYSWLGDEASSLRSDPDEKSGWTKPSAPSIVNVEAASSTSVKVIIKKPVDITGIEKYTANIKGDESKSCDMKEDEGEENLSCEISGLSPGTQYTVNAYSWLGDEASSLRSDPDEKSGWTKPSAPSIVDVEAVSSTSVNVFIKKPECIGDIEKYTANIKGDESKSCDMKEDEGEENLSCEISDLSPGTQYTVNAYSWLGDEASSLHSDPDEKSGWTKPSELSQPSKGKVGTSSVEVIWSKVAGVDGYQARAVESADGVSASSDSSTCETDAQASSCTIEGLKPSTKYSVSVRTYKNIPQNQRIVYKADSPKSPLYGDFSVPLFVVTARLFPLLAVLLGILIPLLIIIIVVVLLYVFRERIPFMKNFHMRNQERNTDAVDAQSSGSALKIEQFEPPELSYLSYLSQIPQPIPFAEFSGRLQALNDPAVSAGLFQSFDDKQTIETFENECRLTRRTAEQFRDRHRYGNVLPFNAVRNYRMSRRAPEGTDERFADPCELLMSRLLKSN
ncbi:hypothetical protein Aperf_G00000121612 [Anoplocephala perfoliata]